MEETRWPSLAQRGIGRRVVSKFDQGVHDVIDAYLPNLFAVKYGERGHSAQTRPHGAAALHPASWVPRRPRTAYVGDSPRRGGIARNAGTFAVGWRGSYHRADASCAKRAPTSSSKTRASCRSSWPRVRPGGSYGSSGVERRAVEAVEAVAVVSWVFVTAWAGFIFFMSSNTSTGLNTGARHILEHLPGDAGRTGATAGPGRTCCRPSRTSASTVFGAARQCSTATCRCAGRASSPSGARACTA